MIIRDILLAILVINFILGGVVIVFNYSAMIRDFKMLFVTFVFGLYGYINYVNA